MLALQLVPVTVAVTVASVASPIVTEMVFVQPLASIAVTVYTPGLRFIKSWVALGMNGPPFRLNVQVPQFAPLTLGLVIFPNPPLQG